MYPEAEAPLYNDVQVLAQKRKRGMEAPPESGDAAKMIYKLIITFNYRNRDVGLFIKKYMKDNKDTVLRDMTRFIEEYKGQQSDIKLDINTMLEEIVIVLIASIKETLEQKKADVQKEIEDLEAQMDAYQGPQELMDKEL